MLPMPGYLSKLWPPPRVIVVNGLRTAWIIVVLCHEIFAFDRVLHACQWPDIHQVKSQYFLVFS